jgi:hypothetical protein
MITETSLELFVAILTTWVIGMVGGYLVARRLAKRA